MVISIFGHESGTTNYLPKYNADTIESNGINQKEDYKSNHLFLTVLSQNKGYKIYNRFI